MNNGLPSLLDAIFGKQDLSLISVEEINEVISEFPSFNAGHFLLAKKMKLQNDSGYDKESMRTALYFNNPFWLQSLLDDGDRFESADTISHVGETDDEERFAADGFAKDTREMTDAGSDFSIMDESNYTFESYTPIEKPVTPEDELDEEAGEILDEKLDSDPERSTGTFQYTGPESQAVTSFDELIAKYHIQPLEMVDESPLEIPTEVPEEPEKDNHFQPPIESGSDISNLLEPTDTANTEAPLTPETSEHNLLPAAELDNESESTSDRHEHEIVKEVVNEYGIFEEIVTNRTDHDHDMDAFDRPLDQIPFVSENFSQDITLTTHPVESGITAIPEVTAAEDIRREEIPEVNENDSIAENQVQADSPSKTDEHDYDSFDRPAEEILSSIEENKNATELSEYDPDNTGEPVEYSNDTESGANAEMQDMSERFQEQQKVFSAFNAKNADSIVFTPYHMVDYFASQGIKLVLEDNPPDQFGKQLKSFTDWLKVMKKLPVQASAGKANEKETEQIRQFAAHSIEERDILTESMAEVLAKQGMYENAIALFQKLSLIYPPKSAYFASRIEQLKAALS